MTQSGPGAPPLSDAESQAKGLGDVRGTGPTSMLWAAFCFIVVAGTLMVFPIWCLATSGLPDSAFPLVSWLTVVYIAIRMGTLAAAGRPSACAIMTFGWTYVFMVVAPGLSAATGRFPKYVVPSPEGVYGAQIITALGLLAFDAAYIAASALPGRPERRGPNTLACPTRLAKWVSAMAMLSVLMLPFTGLYALVPVRDMDAGSLAVGAIVEDTAGSGLAAMLLRNAPVASLLLVSWSIVQAKRLQRPQAERSRLSRVALVSGLVWIVFASPLAVARMNSATTMISLAWVLVRWRSRWSAALWTLVCSIGIFFMFSALDVRASLAPFLSGRLSGEDAVRQVTTEIEGAARGAPTSELAEPHLQLAYGVDYIASHGLHYGWFLSRIPLQWVPRSIWKTKPVAPGEVITRALGNPSNVSSPLWLEGYADFGTAGAMVLLAMWGWLSGRADSALRRYWSMETAGGAGLIVPYLGANAAILLRGALHSGIYRNGTGILLAYLGYRYVVGHASPTSPTPAERPRRRSQGTP